MSGESHLETSGHRPAPSGVSGVNPATGLASDYLNHFYEPLMLLEHIEAAPDLLDDLAAWCPSSYAGIIGKSGRPDRELLLTAYREVQPRVRRRFRSVAGEAGRAPTAGWEGLVRKARGGGDVGKVEASRKDHPSEDERLGGEESVNK